MSKPIRITIDPYEDREIKYQDREGNNKMSNLQMLSGDIIYYYGTGRRERFKAIKNGETVTGYRLYPPKGLVCRV